MNNLKRLSPVFAILGALCLSLTMSCGKGKGDTKDDTSNTPGSSTTPLTQQDNAPDETDVAKICAKLTPSQCKAGADGRCTYNEDKRQCEVAGSEVIHDCGVIKDPDACNNAGTKVATYGCRYDHTKKVCLKNDAPKTVYVWKKLLNMGSADVVPDFKKVVLSQDGNNLYALNDGAPGALGLWHKPKDGDWTILNNFAASPNATALAGDNFTIEKADLETLGLHATKDGAVVQKGNHVVILRGSDPVWALDTTKHNADAADANKFAVVENKPITFSAVVDTKDGQNLLFQQDGTEKLNLLFKSTENLGADPIAMPLTTSTGKEMMVKLYAAANDGAGGLMLGGENIDPAAWFAATKWRINKWGVHHILAANNNPGEPEAGVTSANWDGVIFSSVGGDWPNDTAAMTLVGKFGEYYFTNRNGVSGGKELGGLFKHKGAQIPGLRGTNPDITFDTVKITGTNQFGGVFRVISPNNGLLGAKADLTPDKDKNFSFSSYHDKLEEMMADDRNQAVELSDADNKKLMNILGDENLAYFVVKGVGIYSRTKEQGQPRLK